MVEEQKRENGSPR